MLASFEFDPTGERAATMDWIGTYIVSKIDTNVCKFYKRTSQGCNVFCHYLLGISIYLFYS